MYLQGLFSPPPPNGTCRPEQQITTSPPPIIRCEARGLGRSSASHPNHPPAVNCVPHQYRPFRPGLIPLLGCQGRTAHAAMDILAPCALSIGVTDHQRNEGYTLFRRILAEGLQENSSL